MIEAVHVGHMGVDKCTKRARDVMFWPGMTKSITEYVLECETCLTHRSSNAKEPLKPHPVPDHAWQVIGTDIFTLDNVDFLVTVDYYSRFF